MIDRDALTGYLAGVLRGPVDPARVLELLGGRS